MAGVIGNVLKSAVREEMRRRVDQVLKAGEDWNGEARQLTAALNNLIKLVEQGKMNPKDLEPVKKNMKQLSRRTGTMATALTNYTSTLRRVNEKLQEEP